MRQCRVAIGLVAREFARGTEYLLRWSPHWQQWNLLSGHGSARDCIVAKMGNELSIASGFEVEMSQCGETSYAATSGRTREETMYIVKMFRVRLDQYDIPLFTQHIPNAWATAGEILAGVAPNGLTISEMSRRVMESLAKRS